jgi:putative membrane protein
LAGLNSGLNPIAGHPTGRIAGHCSISCLESWAVDQESKPPATLIGGSVVNELASQRTELSFDQAAMSSDNSLLASVRTSMALMAFGFLIFEYLHKLSDEYFGASLPAHSPRRFGLSLLVLGIVLLCLEMLRHRQYSRERRQRRQKLFERGLIRHPETGRSNSAMIAATLLLLIGLAAVVRIALNAGPL